MLFAQLSNVPEGHLKNELMLIGAALGGLGTIAAIVFGILHAVRSRQTKDTRILPSPLAVTEESGYVRASECAAHHEAMNQRLERLEQGLKDVQQVQREQIGNVHRRIDDMLQVVSRLGGVIGGVQETLRNLHHDLMNLRKK